MNREPDIIEAAETVVGVLEQHDVHALVIGAVALAAYRYVRLTEDMDIGVNADLETLRAVAESLKERGFSVELREPDAADPLGGVLDVSGPFGLLQIINFSNRFPAIIDDAIKNAELVVRKGSRLKLVSIPYLIALKLYAGGVKSRSDIVELMVRNPEMDRDEVRKICDRYRLRGLEELIAEARKIAGR